MNDNKKVLALKYRPQVFKDLIGQTIVADTIINSIKTEKVPNAYLFTGIRGVGKTTIARIVAKSLNCVNGIEKVCKDNQCDNCKAISNSNHIDVLEMDAASKTGVDDVRDLIEFSRYGPTSSKYKIFIIDEVHMLSKQAFNALLKTLEEPPEYLKFIFATTEIKKIPITVVSRCQRFDLLRIKSSELFDYLKGIRTKENGQITDDALRLIVKISEGSVRDALSLLDRALLSNEKNKKLDLIAAQKIFGYFDKSQLINLFKLILKGEELEVLNVYRDIYNQGVDPKVFINDFLEILYYFKNIESLSLESTNFSLNDEDFLKIKDISQQIDNNTLILFWQFTIKTLGELDIVSNQHLSIEMYLIRLMHIHNPNLHSNQKLNKDKNEFNNEDKNSKEIIGESKTVNQIKNISQERDLKPKIQNASENKDRIMIKSFDDLLQFCTSKKEVKLKYELENNVNLVSFENKRIEISFNEKLDQGFLKDLSNKLFEWTNERWIISLTKSQGQLSINEQKISEKNKKIDLIKETEIYKSMVEKFSDAELIDIKNLEKDN
tara:strand:- start:1469 stop:3118 length:1650 start_codon:yes stop_codon:yes gene_type:complete